ncbi:type VII secretion target [Pseudonocardia spirodelae]|uniref:Type VII secretion target n=1 Tax=Pseudonocardia spirodelae TaxID=3133431 RepID=A0ABU8T6Z9_9PSEU
MSRPELVVVPDAVTARARALEEAGAAVAGMRPAQAELDSGAYGVVGAFFSAHATAAMRAGVEALEVLAAELRELAGSARDAAAAYLETELAAAARFGEVEVPSAPDRVGGSR